MTATQEQQGERNDLVEEKHEALKRGSEIGKDGHVQAKQNCRHQQRQRNQKAA